MELESAFGQALPPALRSFWQLVGGLGFVDLDGYSHVAFWRSEGLRGHCDGLLVEACTDDWAELAIEQFADAQTPEGAMDEPFYMDLAPDYHHKDDFSGGASYGMAPGGGWLAPWLHFRWSTPSACAPSDTPDSHSCSPCLVSEAPSGPPPMVRAWSRAPISSRACTGTSSRTSSCRRGRRPDPRSPGR